MPLLEDKQITAGLEELPGDWAREGAAISRTVALDDFMAAIHLVTEVARAAEEINHHPDIDIRYNRIRFRLSSHDLGGITERDLNLAARIDRLAAKAGAVGAAGGR
ncbi:4a-hydroxytetrahydrobiopterin dehydratase [Marinitenerispora sediminis]|uniref:Putative pterin-4-alpha-carbinolamine dehydratase n=1 Tax=Marinitenerispora sediminis TaxID=1931232 RepID=A0A368T7B7_9ACTN|nr:4a-hydroxytetrahydrobiopterin dehydratase [Marinitenerispora sediminis]RCV49598.1 4a-hydroxytetrahydrobiopterin dehydratase [Marinitenerispora sediminis]RCV53054.1 4a-hydroxytetrahydrobiopterin dehydratase [Marinitenerispora sediminis]RCV59799.1 4a-hydroxytetrahydrobiopterin dehydratase [Marinitenerispora sediminis]